MKTLIAIDIGRNLVKVVKAVLSKNTIEIKALDSFKNSQENAGKIQASDFFEKLYRIIPAAELKNSRLALSIPPTSFNFCVLDLPKIPKSELDSVVRREAKRKMPPALKEEHLLRYSLIKENKINEIVEKNILASSAKKDNILDYLNLFKQEGIVPQIISSSPLNHSLYFHEYLKASPQNWALIDIGFRYTTILIFSKDKLSLTRVIPFAGFNFFQEIAKDMKISLEKAIEEFSKGAVSEQALATGWDYLLPEIRRSFAYYKEITKGNNIESIIFGGGIFISPLTLEFLKKHMHGGMSIFSFNSVSNISTKSPLLKEKVNLAPLYMSALGLILSFKSKYPLLNFLPQEMIQEKKAKKVSFFSRQALLGIALIVILLLLITFQRIQVLRPELRKLSDNFAAKQYKSVNDQASSIRKRTHANDNKRKLIADIEKYRLPLPKIFSTISRAIPQAAFISAIDIGYGASIGSSADAPGMDIAGESSLFSSGSKKKKAATLTIDGTIRDGFSQLQEKLDAFCQKLRSSGEFSKVGLEPLNIEELVMSFQSKEQGLTQIIEKKFKIKATVKDKK